MQISILIQFVNATFDFVMLIKMKFNKTFNVLNL